MILSVDYNTVKSNDRKGAIKYFILFLAIISAIAFYSFSVTAKPQHTPGKSKVLVEDTFPCHAAIAIDSFHRAKLSFGYQKEELNVRPNVHELDVYDPVFFAGEDETLLYVVKE